MPGRDLFVAPMNDALAPSGVERRLEIDTERLAICGGLGV
jgi:hypothetical protein